MSVTQSYHIGSIQVLMTSKGIPDLTLYPTITSLFPTTHTDFSTLHTEVFRQVSVYGKWFSTFKGISVQMLEPHSKSTPEGSVAY